mgnify:CR=1 FL=1
MTDYAPRSLADLQAGLQNYVLGDGVSDDILSELTGGASDQSKRRLHIYHSGYRSRMNEALQSAFEQTWAYLGDDAFDAICTRYTETNPSHSPNLGDHGRNFPRFLQQALSSDPEIAELATMAIALIAVRRAGKAYLIPFIPSLIFYFPLGALAAYKAHEIYAESIRRVKPLREMRFAVDYDTSQAFVTADEEA